MKTKRLLIPLLLALLGASPAPAQLFNFTLNLPIQEVIPGGRVTFVATLTNLDTNTLFLNGTSFNLRGQSLSLEDANFFSNFPPSLEPGRSVTAPIFDVTVDSSTILDSYSGSFTIFGGFDPSGVDELATQIYEVTVVSKANPTPVATATPVSVFSAQPIAKPSARPSVSGQ
jgi:hypothetical protein